MADVIVTKNEQGKLEGMGEKGQRAYARFLAAVHKMGVGDTLRFSFWLPRSIGFHRRHFSILNKVFNHQEQFLEEEAFRMWVQVGAGFCDIVPGPKGKPVAIPKSIAFDKLEDADFAEHHAACIMFLRSIHATRFLWPWLSDVDADAMMDSLLNEFM